MSVIFLGKEDIENKANEINKKYDLERLEKPKPIDIFDLSESIGSRLSISCLSKDHSVWGATIFTECCLNVYCINESSKQISKEPRIFEPGTIVIDNSFLENPPDKIKRKENFTMAHESFHFLYHDYFLGNAGVHSDIKLDIFSNQLSDDISKIEWQANYGAACILMPRKVVFSEFKALPEGVLTKDTLERNHAIEKMAERFGVNFSPMKYRLINLGLMPPEKEKEPKLFKTE